MHKGGAAGTGGALWSVSPDAVAPIAGGHAGVPQSDFNPPSSIAISSSGTVTTAGVSNGTITSCSYSSVGAGDGLVLFFESNGTLAKCVNLSSAGDDAVNDVALDSSGAIDIVGSIGGAAKLWATDLTFNGGTDAVVAQFAPDHTVRWAKTFGYEGVQEALGVALDPSQNVYAVGGFEGTILSGTDVLNAVGSRSAFLLKLDKDGTWVWGRAWGSGHAIARAAAASPSGNVVVAGEFDGPIDFGSSEHVSQGGADAFIITIDPNGQVLWSKAFGNANVQHVSRVAVDAQGNLAIAGRSSGDIDFGGGAVQAPNESVFLAVYGPDGGYKWAVQHEVGADGEAVSRTSVAFDQAGNVILGGAFRSIANLGTGPLTSHGDADVFVASYSSAGAALWSRSYGDAYSQALRGLAYDPKGGLALAGSFRGGIDFGAGPVETMPEVGAMFVARFPPW